MKIKRYLLHYTEFTSKQWIRHMFLRDEFSKSNQKYSTDTQRVGRKTHLKIWNRFVLKRLMIFFLDCCRQRPFYLVLSHLLDQSSTWYVPFLSNESRTKRLNLFKRFTFVDSDKISLITNYTEQMPHYPVNKHFRQTLCTVKCGLVSEWVTRSSKSKLLHQRVLKRWDSRDVPSFPPLWSINCQESCNFLFLLQSVHHLQLWEEWLKTHCNPNLLCSTQIRASFLCTNTIYSWACTFLDDEMNIT